MSERVLKERCAQLERLLSAYLSHVSVSTSVPLRRFLGIVSPLGTPLTFDPDAGVCNITLVASDQSHQTIPRAIWNVAHAHAITSLNLNHNKLKVPRVISIPPAALSSAAQTGFPLQTIAFAPHPRT